jgi:hypothetical protein
VQAPTGERTYGIQYMLAKCLQHVGIPNTQQPPCSDGRKAKKLTAPPEELTAQPLRIIEFSIDAASSNAIVLKRLDGKLSK